MNKKNNKIELLDSTPVLKALLMLGLPSMIGMIINAVYSLVDMYFIGKLGTEQLGAISIIFPLAQFIVGIGLLFGNGSASYISRLLGKKEKKLANKVASTALYGGLFVGIIFIGFTMIFMQKILKLLGVTNTILPYAIIYANTYISFSIFTIFNVIMNSIFTSEGNSKITMIFLLISAGLNIILDPLFIFKFNFKIAGAAIATNISQIVSSLLYIMYILNKKSIFNFSIKECYFNKKTLVEIMKMGLPVLFFQILTSVSLTLVNMKSTPYGDSVIAGMGAATRIITLGSIIVFGFNKGFQPIAGYSYGAKKIDRLLSSIKLSIILTSTFTIIFGIITFFFSTEIMSMFTKEDLDMISFGQKTLKANGISFVFFAFYSVYSTLLLALGRGKEGFVLTISRQGFFFIPLIIITPIIFGVNGILYSQAISNILATFLTITMAFKIHKELKNEFNLQIKPQF